MFVQMSEAESFVLGFTIPMIDVLFRRSKISGMDLKDVLHSDSTRCRQQTNRRQFGQSFAFF